MSQLGTQAGMLATHSRLEPRHNAVNHMLLSATGAACGLSRDCPLALNENLQAEPLLQQLFALAWHALHEVPAPALSTSGEQGSSLTRHILCCTLIAATSPPCRQVVDATMQKFGLKGTKSKRDRREAEAVEEADAALDFKVSSELTVWRPSETACLLCSKLYGGFEA